MIGGEEGFLSDSVTLAFLVLNTLFSVVTGLAYSSRTFLVFSFAFGYAVPFLVGAPPRGPFGLLSYNAVLSVAGYALSGLLAKRSEPSKSDAAWLVATVL